MFLRFRALLWYKCNYTGAFITFLMIKNHQVDHFVNSPTSSMCSKTKHHSQLILLTSPLVCLSDFYFVKLSTIKPVKDLSCLAVTLSFPLVSFLHRRPLQFLHLCHYVLAQLGFWHDTGSAVWIPPAHPDLKKKKLLFSVVVVVVQKLTSLSALKSLFR